MKNELLGGCLVTGVQPGEDQAGSKARTFNLALPAQNLLPSLAGSLVGGG